MFTFSAATSASLRIIPPIPGFPTSTRLSADHTALSPSAIMPIFGREAPSSSRPVSMQVSHSIPISPPRTAHSAPTRYALSFASPDHPPISPHSSVSTIHFPCATRSPCPSDLYQRTPPACVRRGSLSHPSGPRQAQSQSRHPRSRDKDYL